MNQTALRMAYFTSLNLAKSHYLNGMIPSTLSSLEKVNPTQTEILNDYSKLSQHFKHPVFQNYVPTYYEMINCPEKAWEKRLMESYNILIKFNKHND